MPRKTVPVAHLLNSANYFLTNSKDEEVERRYGTIGLLESALHLADAYKGFKYLAPSEIVRNGEPYDDSRRFYYGS